MHDKFASTKKPSRQFLLDVVGTLYPGFFQQVIESQTNVRFDKQESGDVGNHVLVTDEWVEALTQHPFESSKCKLSILISPHLLQRRKESSFRS